MSKIGSISAVVDAGPIIHLDELGQLPLLNDFRQVLVPEAVWEEVLRHRPQAVAHPGVGLVKTAAPTEVNDRLKEESSRLPLHPGETEVLNLALKRGPQVLVLTDDTAARLAAVLLGLDVQGTLGLIVRACHRKVLTSAEVIGCLRRIPTETSLHLHRKLLEEAIEAVQRFTREKG